MKLTPKKGGHGHVTSYTALIGSAEARRAGFVTEDGVRHELEKVVDERNNTITIRLVSRQSEKEQK